MEIQRWILGWGAHARVLEPESLKNQLKESAEKLVALYGQPSA
ncbi:MAG: WYL domain-containing protein [Limisphaerales bacterium]